MSDAGWLLFFPFLFHLESLSTLGRTVMVAVLSALQLVPGMCFWSEAPDCTCLLCKSTIKWSLRAGLNWNESEVENILPRANMHSAHGTRLQCVWYHTSNSPSHAECECHFLSVDFVSVLVLLCFPTCSFRLACDKDQFLYILEANSHGKIPDPSVGEVKGFVLRYKLYGAQTPIGTFGSPDWI